MPLTVGRLRVALDFVPDGLPVIVKWDEDESLTVVMDVEVATKQGMSFRIYPDPASRRELLLPESDLRTRWNAATRDMTPAQMEAALAAILEHA